MQEIIPNGTEVLIFCNLQIGIPTRKDELNYIKGKIVSSELSDDLSYHGSPWYEQIYTVIGEDGNTYMATQNIANYGVFFIRTISDYIKRINYFIEKNNDEINKLNKENEELNEKLHSLIKQENKTSTYIPSNDSENIAKLLENFKYSPSKTDEVLSKYQTTGPVKNLKPNK